MREDGLERRHIPEGVVVRPINPDPPRRGLLGFVGRYGARGRLELSIAELCDDRGLGSREIWRPRRRGRHGGGCYEPAGSRFSVPLASANHAIVRITIPPHTSASLPVSSVTSRTHRYLSPMN